MNDPIIQQLLRFLKNHLHKDRPVLLGLSGGPDSLTLFYALLQCQKSLSLKFGVAHVNHGWREESSMEADSLKRLAAKHSIPFHLDILQKEQSPANLEAKWREKRFAFFNEICRSHGYQAVILGHQLDDHVETVLKKIFEGTNLISCDGIKAKMQVGNLEIWRPFLKISRAEIETWLAKRKYLPFYDPTNRDQRYLRGRMRHHLIPDLENTFGKGIKSSLAALASESQELKDFLLDHLSEPLNQVVTSSWGSFVDLSPFSFMSIFEMKFIVRHLCGLQGCAPSKTVVNLAAEKMISGEANKAFILGAYTLMVDRKRAFVMRNCVEGECSRLLLVDKARLGEWTVKIEAFDQDVAGQSSSTNWKDVWQGCAEVVLPACHKPYSIGQPITHFPYPRTSSLAKWWNNHKIPSFLGDFIPVVWQDDTIIHEFLTGRNMSLGKKKGCLQKVSLIRL